jgi:hypothetical protein
MALPTTVLGRWLAWRVRKEWEFHGLEFAVWGSRLGVRGWELAVLNCQGSPPLGIL